MVDVGRGYPYSSFILHIVDSCFLLYCLIVYICTISYMVQGVPKKMSFLGKIAITTFKLIQNAKGGGVLENSGYLLPDGH